ncbi:sensor histidine kinase [Guyparkeria sp.]|uniref:sensor histidine kinase n=1 Tax=Guyparkeria sp. TaxID=2035736 RepID=UPI003970E548
MVEPSPVRRRVVFLVLGLVLTGLGVGTTGISPVLDLTLVSAGGLALGLAVWAFGGVLAGLLVAAALGVIHFFITDIHPLVALSPVFAVMVTWSLLSLPVPPLPPLPLTFTLGTLAITWVYDQGRGLDVPIDSLLVPLGAMSLVIALAVVLLGDEHGGGDWGGSLGRGHRRFALLFLAVYAPALTVIQGPALADGGVAWPLAELALGAEMETAALAALLGWLVVVWAAWQAVGERQVVTSDNVFTRPAALPLTEPRVAESPASTDSGCGACLDRFGGSSDVIVALLSRRGGRWQIDARTSGVAGEADGARPESLLNDSPESLVHPADADRQREMLARLERDDAASARYRLRVPGMGWRWYHVHARRVSRPRDGDDTGEALLLHVDITSVKETERQLVQSSKMATLGEMTAGVAHEINQPLNVIRLATQNLLRRVNAESFDPEYYRGKLERVADQTRRAAGIIDHMRIFGREPADDPEHFLPENSVRRVADLLQPQLDADGIALHLDCEAVNATVWGHESLFEQVIMNLLVNARDAVNGNEERNGREIFVLSGRSAENEIEIRVRDTGGGVPDSVRDRLFQPFFTTKPVGKGTGLGLSMSYGIVQDMNGEIAVRNVAGGAEFTIRLAVSSPESDRSA